MSDAEILDHFASVSTNSRYSQGLQERADLARYVTPFEAKTQSIYNWFVYPHSFSPALVKDLIRYFKLKETDRIFDPFVGAGTTLLAAKEQNISATGLDLLPVSAALSRAKITNYDLDLLKENIKTLKRLLCRPANNGLIRIARNDPLWEMVNAPKSIIARAFDEATLNNITLIKAAAERAASNSDSHNFFRVALLAILESFSSTMKAGGWLKIIERPESDEEQGGIVAAFLARVDKMLEEVVMFQAVPRRGEWDVKIGDARHHHPELGQFKAIISSPPYLNRHDYTRVLSLELLVGCLQTYNDITELRYDLLRSHVEAKTKFQPLGYQKPTRLVEILNELERRKAEKRVLYIVDGYFEDMFSVLRSARLSLKDDGYIAFVLGNVRFSGLAIPVDEIIAEIGESVGLRWETNLIARRRNNSAQQMKKFGRDPSRESIIIWRTI